MPTTKNDYSHLIPLVGAGIAAIAIGVFLSKSKKEHVEKMDAFDLHIAELFKKIDKKDEGLNEASVAKLTESMDEKLTSFFSSRKLREAFKDMKKNAAGKVHLSSFLDWHHRTHPTKPQHFLEQVRHLFDKLDVKKTGKLCEKDIKTLLAETGNKISGKWRFSNTGKKMDAVFKEMDKDGSGNVSCTEFINWLSASHKLPKLTPATKSVKKEKQKQKKL